MARPTPPPKPKGTHKESFSTKPKTPAAPKPTVSLVASLLDESGSMNNVWFETIAGYNTFIKTIQEEQAGKQAYISTFTFDKHTGPILRVLENGAPLANATLLTDKLYRPRGYTPLFDAIGAALALIDAAVELHGITKVTFMIQTDGAENASVEWKAAAVRAEIEKRQTAGWQIIFLGADLANTYDISHGLGVAAVNTVSYSKGQTESMFSLAAVGTRAYRSVGVTGQSLNISAEDKAKLESKQ